MARLAIDKDFLDDYPRLEKKVRNSVKDAIDRFAQNSHVGLLLGKINRSRDDVQGRSGSAPSGAVSSLLRTPRTGTTW